jgi:VacB/RNase II family 3'-5' exoribonuclease
MSLLVGVARANEPSDRHLSVELKSLVNREFMNNLPASRADLQAIVTQLMRENGFEPGFPPSVGQQLAELKAHPPQVSSSPDARDLRSVLWSSIDNDTSRDLDQIEVAEQLPSGEVKVLVGIADVDAFVPQSSPIDDHAAEQTATIYAGVRNFPMLPEQLSTGDTSLLENEDRLAIVIEFVAGPDGCVNSSDVYRALVRNQAQLAYNSVGAWLEGRGPAPVKVAVSAALQAQLKLQDGIAQALKTQRYRHGALNLESSQGLAVLADQRVVDVVREEKNRATELIEDFMIAANGAVARRLENVSSLRRIVKTPEHWDRIVQLAAAHGEKLPGEPDSKALNDFLVKRKAADRDYFPALSLAVIKLIGPGEYVLERPGDPEQGHFGLAVQDYTHSTAPNRRFADLVTQRLIKALLAGRPAPYTDDALAAVARNCTLKEDAAQKVEREMAKRLAAAAMSSRIGQTLDAVVSSVNSHGTFVRVLHPQVEGLLAEGEAGAKIGDKLRVKLTRVDVPRGYVDFARV